MISLLRVVLLLLLLVPSAPAGVFSTPQSVAGEEGRLRITHEVPFGAPGTDRFLFPLAADHEPSAHLERVTFRALRDGELLRLEDFSEADQQSLGNFLSRKASARVLGRLASVPLAVVEVDRGRSVALGTGTWEIARFDVVVTTGAPPEPRAIGPSGELAVLAESLVVNPGDIARWAAPETDTFPGPTRWQPTAELIPVPVEADGLYAIDREWIQRHGLQGFPASAGEVGIWADGNRVPGVLLGPEDGSFEAGARLVFFGAASDSPETRARTYWIGRAERPALLAAPATRAGVRMESPALLRHHVEVDRSFQTRMGAFLSIRRMAHVWETIPRDAPATVTFDLPHWVESRDGSTTLSMTLLVARTPVPRGALVEVSLNGGAMQELPIVEPDVALVTTFPTSAVRRVGNKLALRLRAPESFVVHLDSLEWIGPGVPRLSAEPFELFPRRDSGVAIPVAEARPQDVLALDVTDELKPSRLAVGRSGGVGLVQLEGVGPRRVLLANRREIAGAPAPVANAWSEATTERRDADVMIVFHPSFIAAAELLAKEYGERGLTARVVSTEAVYASFSHGNLSSEAIRNFIARASNGGIMERPQAVVLIGDANADGRNVSRQGIPNFLPMRQLVSVTHTREDFVSTDSFYSWLNPGDELADILVGRFSATTPDEALAMVRKVIRYRKVAPVHSLDALAVSDTGEFGASLEEALEPFGLNARRLDADVFPWEDNYYLPAHLLERMQDSKVSPLFTAAIEEGFNAGAAVALFFGHGAPNLWGNQRFWFGGGTPNSDILRLSNGAGLPFVTSFTCNNAVIDYPLRPWNVCIAEDFMRHEDKGAIAALMPSGPSYLNSHMLLSGALLRGWVEQDVRGVGALSELVRLAHLVERGVDDHSRMFILLGDPLTRIPGAHPKRSSGPTQVDVTSIARSGDARVWTLRNNGAAGPGTFGVTLEDESGSLLKQDLRVVELGERETRPLVFNVDLPTSPGVYTLRSFADGREVRDAEFLVVPAASGARAWIPRALGLRPASQGGGSMLVPITVANWGTESAPFRLELVGEGERIASQDISILTDGATIPLQLPMPPRPLVTEPLILDAILTNMETSDTLRRRYVITPTGLPDLAIIGDSIAVSPPVLSDGLSIFVDVTVMNNGGRRSDPVSINLYKDGTPLRDMTRRRPPMLPALDPGTSHTLRLRHDPWKNAGDYALEVVVDREGLQAESRRDNNSAALALKVLRKWKLRPGALVAEPSAKGDYVRLTAEVGNSGEVDARGVTVTLYRSGRQTDEGRIVEIPLDRVEALTTRTVTFDWYPGPDDATPGIQTPSFTVSLKGSQQRISSVAGP